MGRPALLDEQSQSFFGIGGFDASSFGGGFCCKILSARPIGASPVLHELVICEQFGNCGRIPNRFFKPCWKWHLLPHSP